MQNQTTFTCDILSTQHEIVNPKMNYYTSKVGEKQFSDVQKGYKSKTSKIEFMVVCLQDWFAHHTP